MIPTTETLLSWLKPEATPQELEAIKLLKPGDYEIYSSKLDQMVLEARETFIRMGVSGMIRGGDLGIGLFTRGGDLVSASVGTFMHVLGCQMPVKFIVKNYLDDPTTRIKEGDIFYFSAAQYGGFHNPDQMAIMPVFANGDLVAWTSAIAHQPETGAIEPGGQPITAKTRYEEGAGVPPIRIGENYQIRSDMIEMFNNFCRTPRMQELDLRARVAGCDRLRARIQELARDKGNAFLFGLFRKMILVAEEGARSKIREWNDGTYRAVNFGDVLGIEEGLYRFCVTVRKEGERVLVDFTGTSPEHDAGSYHGVGHGMPGWVALILYNYYFYDLPVSSGPFASFEFIVPQGCILRPGPEAAISNHPPLCGTMLTSLYNIFAKMLFASPLRESVIAPCSTGAALIVSGISQHGSRFANILNYPLNTGGQGARSDMDGMDAFGFHMCPNSKASDFDEVEEEHPFIHLFPGLQKDSCGFGKYRSGAGTLQAYIARGAPQIMYTTTGRETRINISSGLFGGYPAPAKFGLEIKNSNVLQKMKRGDKDIPTNFRDLITERTIEGEYRFEPNMRKSRLVKEGDIWTNPVGGTGGYGDVLERDPALVMADLKYEIISHWTAKNIFKVVYDPETLKVDYQKTGELRQKEREDRIKRGKPYREFEKEWMEKKPAERILKYYGSWPEARKVREPVRV